MYSIFSEEEEEEMLFIFDLNSIASDRFPVEGPLRLDIFTDLVNTFKVIGLSAQDFHYIPNENLIICNSKALTIEYMNSLKEKIKAEKAPLTLEKTYEYTGSIRHADIITSEIDFIRTYSVNNNDLLSTFIDYENKTIIIKSKSLSKRTIRYFASKLIEFCVYIKDGANKVKDILSKYPYRELIKELYLTDFISRTIAVSLPKEDKLKADSIKELERRYNISLNEVGLPKETDLIPKTDNNYVSPVSSDTYDQLREFFGDPNLFNGPSLLDIPVRDKVIVKYDSKVNTDNKFTTYNPNLDKVTLDDKNVANTIKSIVKDDFDKFEDKAYVEVIDTITEDDIKEFFEKPELFNEPKVSPVCDVNSINYNQTEAAHKVVEALNTESKAVSNMFNINDYTPPFDISLYDKDKEIAEFLTDLPETIEEMLDETKAYHDLARRREAKEEEKK